MTIKWGKEFELGIPEIDAQHKQLVDLLNEFYDELKNGHRKENIEKFLEELEHYLNYHLDYEEEFLKKINFPGYEDHKRIHNMFKKIYTEEKTKYINGELEDTHYLVSFTLSWLFSHIAKTDRKYAEFYKKSNPA